VEKACLGKPFKARKVRSANLGLNQFGVTELKMQPPNNIALLIHVYTSKEPLTFDTFEYKLLDFDLRNPLLVEIFRGPTLI